MVRRLSWVEMRVRPIPHSPIHSQPHGYAVQAVGSWCNGARTGWPFFAHGQELSPHDGDPLHAERSGALTKQREHLVSPARLDLGKAVIHLS
jgi:hypothetical protein